MSGSIEAAQGDGAPVGGARRGDLVLHTGGGRRVVVGSGAAAALAVGEGGVCVGDVAAVAADVTAGSRNALTVSGHAVVTGGALFGGRVVAAGAGAFAALGFAGVHRCHLRGCGAERADQRGKIVVAADDDHVSESGGEDGGLSRGLRAFSTGGCAPVVTLSSELLDRRAFGVVAGVEGEEREVQHGAFVTRLSREPGDSRVLVNSAGAGALWVCDERGPLRAGDLVASSSVPGYGCAQGEDAVLACTVAKSTMACDFTAPPQPRRRPLKEAVVTSEREVAYEAVDETRVDWAGDRYVRTTLAVPRRRGATRAADVHDEAGAVVGAHAEPVFAAVQGLRNEVDACGDAVWVPELDERGAPVVEPPYLTRWLLPDGSEVTREEYAARLARGEPAFRAALVGCAYLCG